MAEKIKVTFLGTGSAIPTKNRNHPSVLLSYKEENILFDCGEGTQRQFRLAELNPCKLTKIFISHWHGDHVLGLPGLLQTLAMNNYSRTLQIFGPRGTERYLDAVSHIYLGKNSKISIDINEIDEGKIIDDKEFLIQAKSMDHDTPCLAYSFIIKEKNRLDKEKLKKLKIPENSPLLGDLAKGKTIDYNNKKIDGKKLIYKEQSRKFTYSVDTRENENLINLSQDSDVLITESTYSEKEEEIAKEHAHMTSKQAATIAKKAKVKKLYLIHLSQRYENPKIILNEAKKVFKNVTIPNDLDKIEF